MRGPGTYDSFVYGLLQVLIRDHDAIAVADRGLRATRFRGSLKGCDTGGRELVQVMDRLCINIPQLASLLEPVRESVGYRTLRPDFNGVLRNLLPVQRRRVLGQVPSEPLRLPQRPRRALSKLLE